MSTNTATSKRTTKAKAKSIPVGAQPAPKAKAPTPTLLKVLGQPEKPYRTDTARDKYWALVQQYDGQPVSAFVAFAKANPPSTPAHGKLAGKAEPPMGWVKYFVRQGVLGLVSK